MTAFRCADPDATSPNSRPTPPWDDVNDVELRYTTTALTALCGDAWERSVQQWDVELRLRDDSGFYTALTEAAVELCGVEPTAEECDTAGRVGRLRLYRVDHGPLSDPAARLDEQTAELATVGEALFDDDGEVRTDLADRLTLPWAELLVLDRAVLEPAWCGFGVGALLAGIALQDLGRGCGFAAVLPGSLRRGTPDPAAAAARLAQVWGQLGFEPYRDGVGVLDLGTVTLERAVAAAHQRVRAELRR